MTEKTIPKTKLKRELRKWMHYLDKHPLTELTITVNKLPRSKLISFFLYEMLINTRPELTDEDKAWLNAAPVGEEEKGF